MGEADKGRMGREDIEELKRFHKGKRLIGVPNRLYDELQLDILHPLERFGFRVQDGYYAFGVTDEYIFLDEDSFPEEELGKYRLSEGELDTLFDELKKNRGIWQ